MGSKVAPQLGVPEIGKCWCSEGGLSGMSATVAKIWAPVLSNTTHKPLSYSHSLISWYFPCRSLGQQNSFRLKLLNSNSHFCFFLDSLFQMYFLPFTLVNCLKPWLPAYSFLSLSLPIVIQSMEPSQAITIGLEPASNQMLSFSGFLDLSKFLKRGIIRKCKESYLIKIIFEK